MTEHNKDTNTDKEIIELIQQGQIELFELLVVKYQQRLSNHLYRLLNNSASEVPDAVQETFIRAFKGLKNFRNESQFYTWLYRIAGNVAYNIRDMHKRKPLKDCLDVDELDYCVSDESSNHEDAFVNQEYIDSLNSILDSLPQKLKEPLLLKEYNDYSYEEIAQILDIDIGKVRSRIHRARKFLQTEYNNKVGKNYEE